MASFRLIRTGFADAATNMATDEALFLSHKSDTEPVLRLYGWQPAALSVGRSQDPQELLNLEACRENKVPFIRRPTGGGILFHDDELTYSIILSQKDIATGESVKRSFEKITGFLIAAYHRLGIQASFAKKRALAPGQRQDIADLCLSRKEEYDILVNGKKLGGNAQRRGKKIILQHGSIPLSFNKEKLKPLLRDPSSLGKLKSTTIQEITKTPTDLKKLIRILIGAFAQHFRIEPREETLNKEECLLQERLLRDKYRCDDWNTHARSKTPQPTQAGLA